MSTFLGDGTAKALAPTRAQESRNSNGAAAITARGGERVINIRKPEMIRLLKDYQAERESITAILDNLSIELDGVYQPQAVSIEDTGIRIQKQYDHAHQIDQLMARCNSARLFRRDTLIELKQKTELLDKLMYCLSRMPGDKRAVITSVVMDGETLESYGARMGLSRKQASRIKDQALDYLYESLTKRKVEGHNVP